MAITNETIENIPDLIRYFATVVNLELIGPSTIKSLGISEGTFYTDNAHDQVNYDVTVAADDDTIYTSTTNAAGTTHCLYMRAEYAKATGSYFCQVNSDTIKKISYENNKVIIRDSFMHKWLIGPSNIIDSAKSPNFKEFAALYFLDGTKPLFATPLGGTKFKYSGYQNFDLLNYSFFCKLCNKAVIANYNTEPIYLSNKGDIHVYNVNLLWQITLVYAFNACNNLTIIDSIKLCYLKAIKLLSCIKFVSVTDGSAKIKVHYNAAAAAAVAAAAAGAAAGAADPITGIQYYVQNYFYSQNAAVGGHINIPETGSVDWNPEQNICARAMKNVIKKYGIKGNSKIHVRNNLKDGVDPIEPLINAAATLMYPGDGTIAEILVRLWGIIKFTGDTSHIVHAKILECAWNSHAKRPVAVGGFGETNKIEMFILTGERPLFSRCINHNLSVYARPTFVSMIPCIGAGVNGVSSKNANSFTSDLLFVAKNLLKEYKIQKEWTNPINETVITDFAGFTDMFKLYTDARAVCTFDVTTNIDAMNPAQINATITTLNGPSYKKLSKYYKCLNGLCSFRLIDIDELKAQLIVLRNILIEFFKKNDNGFLPNHSLMNNIISLDELNNFGDIFDDVKATFELFSSNSALATPDTTINRYKSFFETNPIILNILDTWASDADFKKILLRQAVDSAGVLLKGAEPWLETGILSLLGPIYSVQFANMKKDRVSSNNEDFKKVLRFTFKGISSYHSDKIEIIINFLYNLFYLYSFRFNEIHRLINTITLSGTNDKHVYYKDADKLILNINRILPWKKQGGAIIGEQITINIMLGGVYPVATISEYIPNNNIDQEQKDNISYYLNKIIDYFKCYLSGSKIHLRDIYQATIVLLLDNQVQSMLKLINIFYQYLNDIELEKYQAFDTEIMANVLISDTPNTALLSNNVDFFVKENKLILEKTQQMLNELYTTINTRLITYLRDIYNTFFSSPDTPSDLYNNAPQYVKDAFHASVGVIVVGNIATIERKHINTVLEYYKNLEHPTDITIIRGVYQDFIVDGTSERSQLYKKAPQYVRDAFDITLDRVVANNKMDEKNIDIVLNYYSYAIHIRQVYGALLSGEAGERLVDMAPEYIQFAITKTFEMIRNVDFSDKWSIDIVINYYDNKDKYLSINADAMLRISTAYNFFFSTGPAPGDITRLNSYNYGEEQFKQAFDRSIHLFIANNFTDSASIDIVIEYYDKLIYIITVFNRFGSLIGATPTFTSTALLDNSPDYIKATINTEDDTNRTLYDNVLTYHNIRDEINIRIILKYYEDVEYVRNIYANFIVGGTSEPSQFYNEAPDYVKAAFQSTVEMVLRGYVLGDMPNIDVVVEYYNAHDAYNPDDDDDERFVIGIYKKFLVGDTSERSQFYRNAPEYIRHAFDTSLDRVLKRNFMDLRNINMLYDYVHEEDKIITEAYTAFRSQHGNTEMYLTSPDYIKAIFEQTVGMVAVSDFSDRANIDVILNYFQHSDKYTEINQIEILNAFSIVDAIGNTTVDNLNACGIPCLPTNVVEAYRISAPAVRANFFYDAYHIDIVLNFYGIVFNTILDIYKKIIAYFYYTGSFGVFTTFSEVALNEIKSAVDKIKITINRGTSHEFNGEDIKKILIFYATPVVIHTLNTFYEELLRTLIIYHDIEYFVKNDILRLPEEFKAAYEILVPYSEKENFYEQRAAFEAVIRYWDVIVPMIREAYTFFGNYINFAVNPLTPNQQLYIDYIEFIMLNYPNFRYIYTASVHNVTMNNFSDTVSIEYILRCFNFARSNKKKKIPEKPKRYWEGGTKTKKNTKKYTNKNNKNKKIKTIKQNKKIKTIKQNKKIKTNKNIIWSKNARNLIL